MNLPLQRPQVLKGAAWLASNFAGEIQAAIAGTPVTLALVQAIACKETHNIWLGRIGNFQPEELLARCVGDASGDFPGTSRQAFPKNTEVFRDKFGDDLTEDLITETNAARAMRDLSPKAWVYKGYGIFQYDLQHIAQDEAFFREHRWHGFKACADKLVAELQRTFKAADGDVRGAVRRYNGQGAAAEDYADVVMQFQAWCEGRA